VNEREFIGGAATGPLAARAQQPAKLPTIGLLGSTTPASQSELPLLLCSDKPVGVRTRCHK